MQKEITVNVELNAQQIALLLQMLDEQLCAKNIEDSERPLAFEVLAVLEESENFICDLENRINLGI